MAQTAQALAREVAEQIATGRLAPGASVPSVRRLAALHGVSPGTAARSHALLRQQGLVTGAARTGAQVALRPLRLAGSDDPALDLVLRAAGAGVTVVPGERGSVHGLTALSRGQADAAAVHLAHPSTGGHNDPWARGRVLLHLWTREQGLAVAGRHLRGVTDLQGLHLAVRPAGSATRLLLERLLHDAGVTASTHLTVDSHLAVATAVATGAADAGLCVRQAAEAAGTDWVPLVAEPFELLLDEAALPLAGPFLTALATAREQVAALPGYDLTMSGTTRRP